MFEHLTEPLHLTGHLVRLGPLAEADPAELYRIGSDERIWTYMVRGPFTSVEDSAGFLREAETERAAGRQVPFAVYSRRTGALIGSTRYLDIQPQHHSLEVGYTWLTPDHWGTGAAEECQFLLVRHAIEAHGAGRVTLKTDGRNLRAQLALEHFGLIREGVLRKHLMVRDGFIRDTVMYSVLREELPSIIERAAVALRPAE